MFLPDIKLSRNHKQYCHATFRVKNDWVSNRLSFWLEPKISIFEEFLGVFLQNDEFPEKSGFLGLQHLRSSNLI